MYKDKKLLKLEKKLKRTSKKSYGPHTEFWNELRRKRQKTSRKFLFFFHFLIFRFTVFV